VNLNRLELIIESLNNKDITEKQAEDLMNKYVVGFKRRKRGE